MLNVQMLNAQYSNKSRPCNLPALAVVLGIVQRFLKKFGNGCNLGLKAVVIEEQDTNKIFKQ